MNDPLASLGPLLAVDLCFLPLTTVTPLFLPLSTVTPAWVIAGGVSAGVNFPINLVGCGFAWLG